MRVLLIESDSATAQNIELMLLSDGFNVFQTDLGEEGIDLAKIYDYDIILVDLGLPDISGYEFLRALRGSRVKTPILIMSRSGGVDDNVRGFGFGDDDCLVKPFHKDELVARIHAIVRRSKGHAQFIIRTGSLVVNLDTKNVEVDGIRVHLTCKEYQMLEFFSLRKGTILTKEMFLNHLYGGVDEGGLKLIEESIAKLCKKLAMANNGQQYIETVWGRGYVLRDPDEDSLPTAIPEELDRHQECSWLVDITLRSESGHRSVEMEIQAATSREALIVAITRVELKEAELFHTVHIAKPRGAEAMS